jgi:hypothetical protein
MQRHDIALRPMRVLLVRMGTQIGKAIVTSVYYQSTTQIDRRSVRS